MYNIIKYKDNSGNEPFSNWINSFRDISIAGRIERGILQLEKGNFGDCKYLSEGVYELRFFFGSGYRVYFGRDGKDVIILLCGGDKSSQNKDIEKAKNYLKDYLEDKNG